MFDYNDSTHIAKLLRDVRESHQKMEHFRKKRRELVNDYVADWAKVDGDVPVQPMPANNLALMVDILLNQLAGTNPKVVLPTAKGEILPFIASLESITNRELELMSFDKVMRRWVLEAIFCLGVMKCGLADAEDAEIIPGEPQPMQDYFCDVIDFDNLVYDQEANSWREITFIGDRYKIDYDEAMESDLLDEAAKEYLQESNESIVEENLTREIMMEEADYLADDTWRKTAWVWDICLPEYGIVLTLPDKADGVHRALRVTEWSGVRNTPYSCLWFNDIPGSTMPLPPGQVIKSLNRSVNAIYRKLINQAESQKKIGLGRAGERANLERIRNAKDGELVEVDSPDAFAEVSIGGPSPENQALGIQLDGMFSRQAGNMDAMGGLGPQADTAAQDQQIGMTVSQKIHKMSQAVTDASAEVIEDIVYHIWHDPVRVYTAVRQVTSEIAVEDVIEPGNRPGDWSDFDVKVEPYTAAYRPPTARIDEMKSLLIELVFPMLPVLQQQGITVNMQRFFEYVAKYRDLPELSQILETSGTPMPGTTGDETRASKPAVSHRTYERVNRPGATKQGNDQTMQQILSGAGVQQSQAAAIGRPTGV